MSKAYIDESSLTGIGNAIRGKLGVETTYTPRSMAAAISSISTNVQEVFECYVVGQTEYAQGWLSLESGGTALTPESSKLYVIVAGTHANEVYRWSGTAYVMVGGDMSENEIVYGYLYQGTFYEDSQHTTVITGDTSKLYIDYTGNSVYTYDGTSYNSVSSQISFATQSEAETGTDNTKAMTPLRVAQEIAAKTDTNLSASSSNPVKNYVIKQQLDHRLKAYSVAVEETGDVASRSYEVGSYMTVNGELREVTGAISAGDTIDFTNTTTVSIIGVVQDMISSGSSVSVSWSDVRNKPEIDEGEGADSIQEGRGYATGPYSHAEGESMAYGDGSHAEGNYCIANGDYSHAGGSESYADGINAFTHGCGVISNSTWEHPQFVIGSYNVSDTVYDEDYGEDVAGERYAFIIGDGTYGDDRHNLFTISWDGNVVISGHTLVTDSNIAQVEGETASRAYSVGEYMMLQGVLKRVTSAISIGDSIVDDTNVTTTTIMEEIVRLTQ